MREFLLGLYLQHGEREFTIDTNKFCMHYAWARDKGFLCLAEPAHYFARRVPYKITPKALALIRNDS
jgi:hypothetical protein